MYEVLMIIEHPNMESQSVRDWALTRLDHYFTIEFIGVITIAMGVV